MSLEREIAFLIYILLFLDFLFGFHLILDFSIAPYGLVATNIVLEL